MNYYQKVEQVYGWYEGFKNKRAYCEGLTAFLEEKGFKKMSWNSMQTNWFSKKQLQNLEPIKINYVHEFTKDYKSQIDSKAEEETKPSEVDAEA